MATHDHDAPAQDDAALSSLISETDHPADAVKSGGVVTVTTELLADLPDAEVTLEGTYDATDVPPDAPLPVHVAYGHQIIVDAAHCGTCEQPPAGGAEELAAVRAELGAARADHLAAYQRADANGAALLAARAELAELRERHDQLLEDLCRPIPEEDGDDVAAEAIVVRWYGQRLARLGRYRETLETIAEPVVPYAGQPVLTASGMRKLAARALETGDQRTGGAR